MKIKSIKAHRVGPFYESFSLELDSRVTIITGANDVGKSSLLRALELALTENAVDENFINHDHVQESQKPAPQDESITVEAQVDLSVANDLRAGVPVNDGDNAYIRRAVAKGVVNTKTTTFLRNHGPNEQHRINLPAIIKSGTGKAQLIGDIIDLKKPSQLEQAFLDTAFKSRFDFTRFAEMKPLPFSRAMRDAQEELNRLVEKIMPIRFDLLPVEGKVRYRPGQGIATVQCCSYY